MTEFYLQSELDSIPGLVIKNSGNNNRILIEKGTVFELSQIYIIGDNNQISLGKCGLFHKLNINFKGSNKEVKIGKTEKNIRGLKVVSIRGDNQSLNIGTDFSCGGFEIQMNDGNEKCSIGDSCLFSWDIKARTSDGHALIDLNSSKAINIPKDIYIGNRVWIGEGVALLKGVYINDCSVVGSFAVVTKAFRCKNIALAGNPAREVRDNVSWDYKSCTDYNNLYNPPISLVTVVCKADVRLLMMQFSSINIYAKNVNITEHVIICNDKSILNSEIYDIVNEVNYSIPVKVISQSEVLKLENTVKRGWYTQQVCKLHAHKFVNSNFYTVLDSKNFLINQIYPNSLIKDGKPIMFMMDSRKVWGGILDATFNLLNVSDEKGSFCSPSTPFTFIRAEVESMYKHLDDAGFNIEDLICDKMGVTEFICYFAYLKKTGSLSKHSLVNISDSRNYTIFRSAVLDKENIDRIQSRLDSFDWFGIHLDKLINSNDMSESLFVDIFVRYKLVNTRSDAYCFLSALK